MKRVVQHLLRLTCVVSLIFYISSCSSGENESGSGPTASDLVVSGTVTAPGGAVAFLRKSSIIDLFESESHAAVVGSVLVADGTAVQLGRISKTSPFTFSPISTTTTASGRYSFNLTTLGLNLANDLLVRGVGSAGKEMRAFVTNPNVDLNPASELGVRFVLERLTSIAGSTLDRFTLQEVNDLSVSLNLLTEARMFSGSTDLETAIADIRNAVVTDPTLMAFISDSVGDGQTALGPGDQGHHFPTAIGSVWGYRTTRKETGEPTITFNTGRTISGTRSLGNIVETIFYETNPNNSGVPEDDYFVKDGVGIVRRGTSDVTDFLTPQLVPYHELLFPIQAGKTFTQLNKFGIDFSQDVDGDALHETASIASSVRIVGFEAITVPAGTFKNAARIVTHIQTTVLLSRGGSVSVSGTETWWLTPNIGLVKRVTTVQTRGIIQIDTEELMSYSVGGLTGGSGTTSLTIAEGLEQADSGESSPGKPDIASDGTNYLVVSCRELGPSPGIFGVLIRSGVPGPKFPIATVGNADCVGMGVPTASFDGTNYMVFYSFGDGLLRGTRVSTSGVVLDNSGFILPGIVPRAVVAFDGTNYLVVSTKVTSFSHDIYGWRVTPTGQVLDEFPISSAAETQFLPAVSFDGTNYMVVWTDQRMGGQNYDIYGARVTTSGTVLDPAGIPIATSSHAEEYPQLVFDGSNYMVVWETILLPASNPPTAFEIRGSRVSPAGVVLDGLSASGGIAINTAAGINKEYPTVVVEGNSLLVAWAQGSFGTGGDERGIYGARLSRNGQIIEGGPPATSLGLKLSAQSVPLGSRFVFPSAHSNSSSTLLAWTSLGGASDTTKEIQGTIAFK